ncbi:MAG: [Synergistaceae bacterium]|nr:[FeFe] hydrogenase H-cluster radical SAM maturase HydE [Synergistaceae bacterium]
MNQILSLIHKLEDTHSLELSEYEYLIEHRNNESSKLLRDIAVRIRHEIYGNHVYVRGLIEITNICRNDCFYCGIRRSNMNCERYRLSPDEIIACSDEGHELG